MCFAFAEVPLFLPKTLKNICRMRNNAYICSAKQPYAGTYTNILRDLSVSPVHSCARSSGCFAKLKGTRPFFIHC